MKCYVNVYATSVVPYIVPAVLTAIAKNFNFCSFTHLYIIVLLQGLVLGL